MEVSIFAVWDFSLKLLLSQSDRASLLFLWNLKSRETWKWSGWGRWKCLSSDRQFKPRQRYHPCSLGSLVTILEMELDLVEVLAHERSLMLAILAHLPFTSLVGDHISNTSSTPSMLCILLCLLYQVALESTSSQIYQLYCSYGGFPFHLFNVKSVKKY